jgi:hypothetical protein
MKTIPGFQKQKAGQQDYHKVVAMRKIKESIIIMAFL